MQSVYMRYCVRHFEEVELKRYGASRYLQKCWALQDGTLWAIVREFYPHKG